MQAAVGQHLRAAGSHIAHCFAQPVGRQATLSSSGPLPVHESFKVFCTVFCMQAGQWHHSCGGADHIGHCFAEPAEGMHNSSCQARFPVLEVSQTILGDDLHASSFREASPQHRKPHCSLLCTTCRKTRNIVVNGPASLCMKVPKCFCTTLCMQASQELKFRSAGSHIAHCFAQPFKRQATLSSSGPLSCA